ncbi:hypothetical protein DUI87_01043 [Hirundo rustica rustica]|uniref:RNase H type-1 domain-containing protein n=1 Tax=Hirundo rustica rustica TaxID=333673 RepID=A0A3M0LM96_HIRRU|nr:hypothetical protein DUI87_01043 [Hirundo rustica rustica]
MLKYQALLLEQDDVTLKITSVANPAMFLSSTLIDGEPEHNFLQTIEEIYSSRSDLKDVPLENPYWKLFTDGSSFTKNDKRMMGYAVTTQDKVIKAKALPADVSSQKAELIALTRALDLSEGKKVNIWTNFKYVFSIVHIHGAARGIAEKGILAVIPQKEIDLSGFTPKYDQADHKLIKFLEAKITESGWAVTPANQVVVPPLILQELAQREHENTHFGVENLLKHLKRK